MRRVLRSLELKANLSMLIEIDNKGTVDLINNWNMGVLTRHLETHQFFLCEMKYQFFYVIWISSDK